MHEFMIGVGLALVIIFVALRAYAKGYRDGRKLPKEQPEPLHDEDSGEAWIEARTGQTHRQRKALSKGDSS